MRTQANALERPVAFVMSGGAALGASQVGMLRALFEAGVTPDLLVGVSVGSINAAFLAMEPSLQRVSQLSNLWRSLRRQDLFPAGMPSQALRLVRGKGSLFPTSGLEHRLTTSFGASTLIEQASVPVGILATRMPSGLPKVFTHGPLIQALLASAAIPGVLPAVEVDGVDHLDGALVSNVPLVPAELMGARSYVVLDAGPPCGYEGGADTSVVTTLMNVVAVVTRQRIAVQLPRIAAASRVVYLAAPCSMDSRPLDFGRSGDLEQRAYNAANDILAAGWSPGNGLVGQPHFHDDQMLSEKWGLERSPGPT